MHHGSCQCGEIQFKIEGELGAIVCCHCSQCRKAQGTAFATNTPIESKNLIFSTPTTQLGTYESSPGKVRTFCKACGTPIYSQLKSMPEVFRVRLGTIDSNFSSKPIAHIFTASKANWYEINDDLPQHDEREPGR